ncbi:MAG TPA: alpha-amylase family glycosyl hydrolase [Roseiflexaceae bacterium]|nr:alpha-amylase family glycosyl hydrolase [Roseiflexaceae bacterium]
MTDQTHRWWQRGVIYQIYPRSYQDSDGDGVGDLRGILGRLDYLQWLGVDAIWISPIYPSPMADFGYDVSDYCDIHPLFGTLADFDTLLAAAHARSIKVILDLVPNHTSSEHPWFRESRSGRASPKRDWYIWRDPAPGGGPPNNWLSVFGGPAWTWDAASGQYYLHSFLPEQPDLNWRNPEVQRAMLDAMRFWLDRGVDGFRVDVIWLMIKDAQFRDNPPNPNYQPGQPPINSLLPTYTADQPEVFDIIRMMRATLDAYDERMMVGEIYLPIDRLMAYYGPNLSGCHLPFNFQLILLPWRAEVVKRAVDDYEAALPPGGWPNWVLGNHDQPRVASRVGAAQARVAAMLLLTLRGTPTVYYGDEIGMQNVPIPPEQFQDPQGKNIGISRDPSRTPMQWDATPNAGFTSGTPWLPLAADYQQVNVAAQRDDQRSLLTLHRRLIALRRAEPALSVGAYVPLACEGDVLAYLRERGGRRFLVALNLGALPQRLAWPGMAGGRVALSTHLDRAGEPLGEALELRPDEGLVVALA